MRRTPTPLFYAGLVITLLLIISPVAGYKENFQHLPNQSMAEYFLNNNAMGGFGWPDTSTGFLKQLWGYETRWNTKVGDEMQSLGTYSNTAPFFMMTSWGGGSPTGYPSTYWAWTVRSQAGYDGDYPNFYDTSGVYQCGINVGGAYDTPHVSRIECKLEGNHIHCLRNGKYVATGSCTALTQNPSYITFGQYGTVDDVIIGDSESKYIVGGLSDYFFIKKDLINPAATGLYFTNDTLYKSTGYNLTYAKADNSTVMNLVVSNFQTGTVAESLKVERMADWVGFNVSNITGNSAIQTGLMKLTLDGTGVSDYFWYTAGGATVWWNDDSYGLDESGSAYYSVTAGYWDTATYSYSMKLLDETGEVKDTQTVTAQSGHKDFTFSSDDFIAGETIYAVLYATDLSSGTEYALNYATAMIMSHSEIEGYVVDATTGLAINKAFVNLTESGTVHTGYSTTTGMYNITGLGSGAQWDIQTNKSGYQNDNSLFVPLSIKKYWFNISLIPNSITVNNGSALIGIVKEAPYNSTSQATTVYAWNDTIPLDNSTVTSMAGFYMFDGQPAASLLNVTGIKYPLYKLPPLFDRINTSEPGTFVRNDIFMARNYTLQLYVKDSKNSAAITTANVTASGSASGSYTTTLGYANITSDYGSLTVSASAEGYYPATETYAMDRDRSETIYLSTITDTDNTNLNTLYPREVRFMIVDRWNNKQTGVTVTAEMTSSTIENTNWLTTLFGIQDEATAINTTTLTGTTDDYGSIIFPMIASGKYELTMTKASAGISETKTIYPDQTSYTIIVGTTATAIPDSKSDYIHMNLSIIDVGTDVYLVGVYNDTSATTTNAWFYLNYSNRSVYKTFNMSAQSWSFYKIVNNTKGNSYVWGINATSSTWGVNHIEQGITLNGLSDMMFNPFDPTRTGWE